MRLPHALLPDLAECVLEDRVLMVYGPGLLGNVFLSYNPFSNALVVPGTSGSSGPGGGSSNPGPSFYNLLVGQAVSTSSSGALSPGSGGNISLFSNLARTSTSLGAGSSLVSGRTNNSSLGSGGSSGSGGRTVSGYGSQFSSGFSFAIGNTNNYGMNAITLGSVPVHTFGGGGEPVVPGNATDNNAMPDDGQNAPMPGPVNSSAQGVDVNPRNNLLGGGGGRNQADMAAPQQNKGPGW